MKTSFKLSVLAIIAIFTSISFNSFSQEKGKKTEEIVIKTSAVCGMCKDRIEHDLSFEKGVKSVSLDLETKEVTVKYDPNKTDPDKIRKAISKIGYDADDVTADPVAYEKLPKCCKKDAAPH
jgi:periplasmic mercuric ion binding protein